MAWMAKIYNTQVTKYKLLSMALLGYF